MNAYTDKTDEEIANLICECVKNFNKSARIAKMYGASPTQFYDSFVHNNVFFFQKVKMGELKIETHTIGLKKLGEKMKAFIGKDPLEGIGDWHRLLEVLK